MNPPIAPVRASTTPITAAAASNNVKIVRNSPQNYLCAIFFKVLGDNKSLESHPYYSKPSFKVSHASLQPFLAPSSITHSWDFIFK
jgi:hypothetical protein